MDNGQMYSNENNYMNNNYWYNMNNNYYKKRKSKRFKIILTVSIIAAVLATALTITLIVVFNSDDFKQKSLEGALELYFEAYEEYDYAKYMELLPPYWKNYMKADIKSANKTNFRLNVEKYGCANGGSLSYRVKDVEEMDRSKLSQINRDFENWYGMKTKIQQAVYLDIEMKNQYDNIWTFTDLCFLKIDGKWYVGYGFGL